MDRRSEYARQWIEKARSDLLNADNNLAASRVPYDTVCFHCQQAAEKLMKGFRFIRITRRCTPEFFGFNALRAIA